MTSFSVIASNLDDDNASERSSLSMKRRISVENGNKKIKLSAQQKKENHLASEKKRRYQYQMSVRILESLLPIPTYPDKNQCELIWRGEKKNILLISCICF